MSEGVNREEVTHEHNGNLGLWFGMMAALFISVALCLAACHYCEYVSDRTENEDRVDSIEQDDLDESSSETLEALETLRSPSRISTDYTGRPRSLEAEKEAEKGPEEEPKEAIENHITQVTATTTITTCNTPTVSLSPVLTPREHIQRV